MQDDRYRHRRVGAAAGAALALAAVLCLVLGGCIDINISSAAAHDAPRQADGRSADRAATP